MTFCVEIEDDRDLQLDYEKILTDVALYTLDLEKCPYEVTLNLTITNDEAIKEINKEFRDIDKSTDVLSFPMNEFLYPSDFSSPDIEERYVFDPDSGELILGDIVISLDHVISQAEEFGHTTFREISFLIAHSVLHLLGYDHMNEHDESIMFNKQDEIMNGLKIFRG